MRHLDLMLKLSMALILFAACKNGGEEPAIAPSPKPIEPAPKSKTYAVVLVASNDVLNVRSAPNASAELVTTLAHDAKGVRATGKRSDDWIEIEGGWVNGRYLTEETFDQARAEKKLAALIDVLKARGDLRSVTGSRGLYIAHYGPLQHFPPASLGTLLSSVEKKMWVGPACDTPCDEGTFYDQLAAPLIDLWSKPDKQQKVDAWIKGGNASADIPAGLTNFHFISLFHQGTEANDHLDWRSFGVYFDHQDGEPVVVALAVDQWSP